MFSATRDWSTAALDPGAWHNTTSKRGYKFDAAWMGKERKAPEKRYRKSEGKEADKVEVALGVTI